MISIPQAGETGYRPTAPHATQVSPWEFVRSLGEALADVRGPVEAAAVGVRWLAGASGDPTASVHILVPDRRGRLQPIPRDGASSGGRASSSASRRESSLRGTTSVADLRGAPGRCVALFPLIARGATAGLAEIITDRVAFQARRYAIEAIIPHVALAIGDALGREHVRFREDQLDLGIAMTAHELRGPLLGVRAALESVLFVDSVPEVSEAMIIHSVRELEYMSGLTQELLRWAAGDGLLRPRPTDLTQVLQEAADSCRMELSSDRVSVQGPHPTIVPVDPAPFRGAMTNLIRNALVYSPPASPVEVTVRRARRSVSVCVQDYGPGVAPEERDSIFHPFVRGAQARSHRTGRGLGLFIARRIIEAHEGRLWVDVGASGEGGAAFRVELPTDGRKASRCAS